MIKSPNDIWYVKPSSRGNEIYMLGLFESYVYSKPPYWGVSNTTGCHCKTIIPHQMHPNSQIFWLYSMHPSIQYSPHVWYHLKLDILNSYRLNWLNHLNPPNPKIKSLKSPNIARKISLNPQQTTNLSTFSPRKSAESPLFDTSSSVSPPSAAASDTTPDLASERLRPPAAATSAAVTRGLLVARTAFTTLSLALGGAHKLVFNYFYCLWWYLVIIIIVII